MSFTVPRAIPFSLLAALALAGCAEKGAAPLKKGEKPVDVASVVRQKSAGVNSFAQIKKDLKPYMGQ